MQAISLTPLQNFSFIRPPATIRARPNAPTFPMQHLNPQQLEAVTHLGSPLLVIAGAGSGKTGVITQKIAWLIRDAGYAAKNVFAVTFTNKAAKEMGERSRALLGKEARGLSISTFHRLGLTMLQQDHARLGLRRGFSILDGTDSTGIIRELGKMADEKEARAVRQQISWFKNANIPPELVASHATDSTRQLAAQIYPHYIERLRAFNAVDFDDLLLLPQQLLREHADLREKWQTRIRYLLVDEYQDTNDCQYALMRLLTGAGEAFTVVGDDDQSIYAFRGAQPQNLLHLHEDYPRLKTVKLEQNYRCDQRILTAANALIANNAHIVEKRLWSTIDDGEGIHVYRLRNEEAEAEFIASDILTRKIARNAQNRDFAILYRSNFQARILEQALRELSIPYTLSGGQSFFDYTEIRDLLAYLRLINNPEDDAAFLRICNVPKRELGAQTIAKLGAYAGERQKTLTQAAGELALHEQLGGRASHNLTHFLDWLARMQRDAEHLKASELLAHILHDIEYHEHLKQLHKDDKRAEKSMERLGQLSAWFKKLEEDEKFHTLAAVIQQITLMDILEGQEKEVDAVQLMTLHSAKGLEFPYVYIAGCEEDLLPHLNSTIDEDGIAEERRLLYVGMTRAKKTLTLTYAKQRKRAGGTQPSDPSRFLDELPETGIHWHDGRVAKDPEVQKEKRATLFSALHKMLGNEQN
ncbi:MAG: UvrD-helicase domain-containing protein [Cardiobacteriaceae bacterium]|nr:UvrD-helicase domain-containing protein [Cardiobacteriaceae bacterium]